MFGSWFAPGNYVLVLAEQGCGGRGRGRFTKRSNQQNAQADLQAKQPGGARHCRKMSQPNALASGLSAFTLPREHSRLAPTARKFGNQAYSHKA